MEHLQATLTPTSLDRLARTFSEIDSYGVEARILRGDDPARAMEHLQRDIRERLPGAIGSCVFWLAGERDCFDDEGTLRAPLRLHCSGEESARVARVCAGNAGLAVLDADDRTLEIADPNA